MAAAVHELHFRHNDRGTDPVAQLPDGTAVFPDNASPVDIRAGETWKARVERKGEVAFAFPLKRIGAQEPPSTPNPEDNQVNGDGTLEAEPQDIEAFLSSQPGHRFMDDLADRLADRIGAPLKGRLTKLEKRLSGLEQKLGELKVAHRRGGGGKVRPQGAAKRPVLIDGEAPDADFIERKILYQLYRLDKWKSTHTSGEKFKRGYLNGVPEAQIQAVVDELVRKDVLIAHGKRPDEEYSLNPARADYIYHKLDVDRSRSTSDPDEAADGHAEPETATRDEASWVDEGTFENTIRSVREELATLRKALAPRSEPAVSKEKVEAIGRRVKDVEGRASGLESKLTKTTSEVSDLASEVSVLKEDAEERSKREEDADDSSAGQSRAPYWIEADAAAAVPALVSTLGPEPDVDQVRGLVDQIHELGWLAPLPSTQFGVGQPGTCVCEDCEAEAAGVVHAYDLTPSEPRLLAAPACQEHVAAPPIVVYIDGELDRRSAPEAVDQLQYTRDELGQPDTKRLSSKRIQFHGSAKARRQWDLAARGIRR